MINSLPQPCLKNICWILISKCDQWCRSDQAYAIPFTIFVAPGPRVEVQTPGLQWFTHVEASIAQQLLLHQYITHITNASGIHDVNSITRMTYDKKGAILRKASASLYGGIALYYSKLCLQDSEYNNQFK